MISGGGSSGPGRLGRVLTAVLAVVVAVVVVIAVIDHGRHSPAAGPVLATPASPSPSTSATPSASPSVDGSVVRIEALQQLLARRAKAVLTHNTASWLATVDPRAKAFRAAQAAEFANLTKIPLSSWSYQIVGAGAILSPARAKALGPQAWVEEVDLGYRIKGVDRVDAHSAEYLSLVRRSGHWYVATDTDGPTAVQIWDLGPITVRTGASSVVIGLGSAATMQSYAAQADAAVGRVSAVWGTGWPRKEVVIVPATQAQMGKLLQRSSASLNQIAAVTTGELTSGQSSGQGGADQIIINPAGFARLGTLGRRVVITHETTHVAVRASTPDAVPTWLSEGFADYVGYLGTGLPATDIASDVLALVRAHKGPTQLPSAANFDPANGTIAPYYSASWLACELISQRYGQRKLIAFYRAAAGVGQKAGAEPPSPTTATKSAFSSVLKVSQKSFTASWLAYLTTLSRS